MAASPRSPSTSPNNNGWLYASEMERGVYSPTGSSGSSSHGGSSPTGGRNNNNSNSSMDSSSAADGLTASTATYHVVLPDGGDPFDAEWTAEMASKSSSKTELESKERHFISRATEHYWNEQFDASLFYWLRAEYVCKLREADTVTQSLLSSNVAASLHHLSRFGEAIERYTAACHELRTHKPGRLARWVGMDVSEERIAFLEHRRRLAIKEERPRIGEYLSGNGQLMLDGKENWKKTKGQEQWNKQHQVQHFDHW